MLVIPQIQEFSKPKSALKENAKVFTVRFESNWRNLQASCKEVRLSKEISLGQGSEKQGFIKELESCLEALGLESLSSICEKYHRDHKNVFQMRDFLDEILMIKPEQLKKLAKLHSEVVQVNPGEVQESCYRGIVQFFEDPEIKNSDRIEVGHLLMMLSQLAIDVVGLKTIFNQFGTLTLEKIDEILEIQNPDNIIQHENKIDEALESIVMLQNSLSKHDSNLVDLKLWNNTLSRQRRDVLKWMLVNTSEGIQGSRERMHKAMRGLKAWGEWKILCRYDQRAESAMGDEKFSTVISQVREQLQVFCHGFANLCDSIENLTDKENSCISLYCQELLSELQVSLDNILAGEGLHQNLKKTLQKLKMRTQSLLSKVKIQLNQEIVELKELPEVFQRRLLYLSYEIPRILARGNSKEIKNMALLVNFNYRLTKILMTKSKYDHLSEAQKERLTSILQNRTTKVVQSSTELVRMMMPAK